jgi:ubiquinone/menaquinone biosynthesis C-methylase UbiE
MANLSNQGWSDYRRLRIPYSAQRARAWTHIARYLQRFVPEDASVLELACGYGDFSNNIRASVRVAMDANPDFETYLDSKVRFETGDSTVLARFTPASFDMVFASNFLEHLDRALCERVCNEVNRVLRPGGSFMLMQPNFALRPRQYFDDYTHVSVFTDRSLSDFLAANGFVDIEVRRRFLPLSFRSKSAKLSWLVPLYLRFPVKPLAGQMLVVARKA